MLSFLFFFYLLSSLTIYDIDNEFERELLSIRSIFSLVRPYKLSYIYSMLKQYSFFIPITLEEIEDMGEFSLPPNKAR